MTDFFLAPWEIPSNCIACGSASRSPRSTAGMKGFILAGATLRVPRSDVQNLHYFDLNRVRTA
jgi:hypothetical protein